jgi:3-hydroxyisobutyrate dehydrogenase
MGVPIARRLLSKGWKLTVWDRDQSRFELVEKAGARWGSEPGKVRAAADVVLICVIGDDVAVDSICFGVGGLSSTKGAHIVIDLSTTGMELTLRAAEDLDVAWLDSPMSGSPESAEKGELTLMVGGTEELVDWVRPVLETIASNITLMGPLGAGQTTMMIHQAIIGTNYVLMAEILAQVRAAGIDVDRMIQSLRGGLGDSQMLQHVLPQMAAQQFDPPRVKASQTLEDMQIIRVFNESNGLTLPVQEIAIDQFRHFADRADPETDSAAIAAIYEPES